MKSTFLKQHGGCNWNYSRFERSQCAISDHIRIKVGGLADPFQMEKMANYTAHTDILREVSFPLDLYHIHSILLFGPL